MLDGRAWIAARYGAAGAEKVAEFVALVTAENTRQNLIAPSTVDDIWQRHVLDSAQLLDHDRPGECWVDIGTGGGFPGMIVALLRDGPVMLVEPRSRRAAFLSECVAAFGLDHVSVHPVKIEKLAGAAAGVISARAVASIDALLHSAGANAGESTRWVFPRGRNGAHELAALSLKWQGMFHVEHSVVDPASVIVILEQVRPR